jgi:hypothetical protein
MDTEYRVFVWREEGYDRETGALRRSRWEDSGEGSWTTFLSAQDFAEAEVGAPWRIVAVVPIMQRI